MFASSHLTPEGRYGLALDQIEAGLDVLTQTDPTELDPRVLAGFLLKVNEQARRVGAVQAAVADRFASSGVWADDGAKTAHVWVTANSNESQYRVLSALITGSGMRAHPEMGAAYAEGKVTSRHVDILAETARKFPTVRGALQANADTIVEIATHMQAKDFAEHLTAWCHMFDPSAVERDERKRDSEAYLHLSRIGDGMWRVDGLLPDEVGTQFKAVMDAALRRLRAEAKKKEGADGEQGNADSQASGGSAGQEKERTEDNEPRDDKGSDSLLGADDDFAQEPLPDSGESGKGTLANSGSDVIGIDVFGNPILADEPPTEVMDHRFGSRQNVDALRYLLNLVAPVKNPDGTIALPSVNGARPVVHLTVDIEALLEESHTKAAAWLERFGVPKHVISAAKAKLLACDAQLEPMIMRDGQLVATLPSIQTVPAHLRKAVMLRDEQCRINSCDAPIAEIHHLIYLSQGGPTEMSNLAGLCWYHHHMIHEGKWTLTGDANHQLTLTNTATGQQWTNRPPRKRSLADHRHRKRE